MDPFLSISLFLIIYLLLIISLKNLNFWRKKEINNCNNCCPECKNPLERIKRQSIDLLVNYLTLQLFPFKRYKCLECAWEGLRWDKPYRNKF